MTEETSKAEEAPRRWHPALRWTVEILVFVVLLGGVLWFQTRSLVETGNPAPAFELATLDGGSLALSELEGRPTILFFWAPWCGVCKADAHNIVAVREAVGDDVNVVSVALSFRDIASVRAFASEHDLEGPIVLGDRPMAEAWAIDSFPTLYVLDPAGNVSSHAVGYTTELGMRARLWRASLE